MKITILGYSGSGKSTLAGYISKKKQLPLLHLDQVHHLSGWKARSQEEKNKMIRDFLTENDSWVIDGNYSKNLYAERTAQADIIILMRFNRFDCLYRVYRRYKAYKGTVRPDMADGCVEKLDWEFVRWILCDGRRRSARERQKVLLKTYPEKIIKINTQRQLDRYMQSI